MKPAWSLTSTGSLPQALAKATAAATVASLAVIGRTTSTSAMAGAGLKKWMPHTRSGRPVAIAISTTGRVEVLVARIVSGLQMLSSSAKRSFLTARSSTTDSITRSTSTSSPRWVVARDPAGDLGRLGLGALALLDLLGQRLGQAGHHGVGAALAPAAQHHLVPGRRPPPRRCPSP